MFSIIPTPKACDICNHHIALTATVAPNTPFPYANNTLIDYANRLFGVALTPASNAPAITFLQDSSLPSEGYTLTAKDNAVTITSSTSEGAQHGVATLLQLLSVDKNGLTLPACHIQDTPDCSWRGVMVDLARDWHDLSVLYEYVDMCRFFKIRYLHLHFTDDQSYTLPSKSYPNLSTAGRHYTEEQIKGLVAYAHEKDIEIIPEIDVPGHCTSFANAYGDIFGRDGIICQSEASMNAMETIFRELCDLFVYSTYVHVGGDEAAIDKWLSCPATMAAYKAKGYDTENMNPKELTEIMYATFVARTCEAVTSCGKTPVVWEGFHESVNHLIPANVVVMSWENYYQTTPQLQAAGFRLINCSWSPMYVVTPVAYWSLEEVYNWNIYTWRPVHPGSPYLHTGLTIEPTNQIEGGQLLAWGDHIPTKFECVADGVREEQRLMEERALILAQNTWHIQKVMDYATFAEHHSAVLAKYAKLREV